MNKERFCNVIASVVLIDTSIQNDLRLKTKEILLTSDSKRTKPSKLPYNKVGITLARLVHAKGGFKAKLYVSNVRRWIHLKFCLANFDYLI